MTVTPSPVRLLRVKDVLDRYGISRTTLHVKVKSGDFPAPVPGWKGYPRWLLEDLTDWEQTLRYEQ